MAVIANRCGNLGVSHWEICESSDGEVRQFHCYVKYMQVNGKDGGVEKQSLLWKTIDNMTRAEMVSSCRSRLAQAKAIEAKVKADVQYWDNTVARHIHAKRIGAQLGFALD